jgi:type IV pilus assembly protein PilC
MSRELRRGRLKHVIEQIASDLRGGKTLDEALRQREGALPPVFAAAVTAGVRAGRLPEALATLNHYARTVADLRSMVVGSLYYPAILLVFGIGLFLLVALGVAPGFRSIFDDFGIPIPTVTLLVLAICAHPFLYVVGPIAWVVGGGFLFWFLTRWTPAGRRLFSRLVYSLPLWGVLLRSVRMASFSDLLALLVQYEVPLPEAVSLAGRSTTDPELAHACAEVEHDLRQGESLSVALDRQPAVPAMVTWMIAVGEPRGMLAGSLRQLSEIYHRRSALRANLLRSVLPPFLVVAVGLSVVGFCILGLFLPLITFISALSY